MSVALPLISVAIASYNYARFITTAVDSVLRQTFLNVEVVVTDNGSTDGTAEVIAQRYGNDPRVRFFENERNLGIVGNFNRAFEHARGEFILWLSADDWILPEHLARLYDVLERNPAIDVVYSGIYFADAQGRIFSTKTQTNMLPFDYVDLRDELPEMLTGVPPLCLPSALFRRSVLDELGAMDESVTILADWELAVRLAVNGKRFAFLAEPSTVVRAHGANASGLDFNASGQLVVETVSIFEKFIDHPAMARLRGRERQVLTYFDGVYEANRKRFGGEIFTADLEARRERVRRALAGAAGHYEPARVRESTVTVVLPVSGPPEPALRALDSLVAQTFPNWQVVLVDQGVIPLRHRVRDHPAWERMAYVRHGPRRTPGAARNLGARLGRGEYLAFLDDDNRYEPEHLASLADVLARTGAEVAAAGARLVVEQHNPEFTVFTALRVVENLFRGPADPPELAALANALPLNAILHHRRFFEHAGGFNTTAVTLEDFDYLSRLQSVARLAFSGTVTLEVHARVHLAMQALQVYGPSHYVATLQELYQAREVAGLEPARAAHRAAVARAFERYAELIQTPDGVVELLATLAGRTIG